MCRLVRGQSMSKNILDFFPAGQMKQKTAHEWCGSCLSCGGNDRFNVWPGRPGGGYYMCRGCDPQGGDGIQFMRKYMGMSYAEACAALGIEPKRTTTSLLSARRTHARTHPAQPAQIAPVPPKSEPVTLPCAEWMANAAAFLAGCQSRLDCIPAAVVELCLHRGITLDSAAQYGLGWNVSAAPSFWPKRNFTPRPAMISSSWLSMSLGRRYCGSE